MHLKLANLALASASLVVAGIIAEGLARVVLEPVDYLRPELVRDSVLRWRVEGNSAGHDRWGYRNTEVPDSAPVVALGDSQTYGQGTSASSSWPSWLRKATGLGVYNLGLGGYGPLDYRFLAETRLDSLAPRQVVIGLYVGNDFVDAYRSVQRNDHWRELRVTFGIDTSTSVWTATELPNQPVVSEGEIQKAKDFLSRHSVLYGVMALAGRNRIRTLTGEAVSDWDSSLAVLRDSGGRLITVLQPSRSQVLDEGDPRVRDGFTVTMDALKSIALECGARGIAAHIVVIPSKERVYHLAYPDAVLSGHRATLERLSSNEAALVARLERGLDSLGVAYTDPLPDLVDAAVAGAPIYPKTANGHPTGNGYHVIATSLARDLGYGSAQ